MQEYISEIQVDDINLENFVKNYYVFLDTCSLMQKSSSKLRRNLEFYLKKYNKKLIISFRCLEELEKHSHWPPKNGKKIEKFAVEQAFESLEWINKILNDGYLDVGGKQKDNFADNVLISTFNKYTELKPLALISQDNALCQEILAIDNDQLLDNKPLIVGKIDNDGFIILVT